MNNALDKLIANKAQYIALYNARNADGQLKYDSRDLAKMFKVGERTAQRFEKILRKNNEIKYRKELPVSFLTFF